MRVSGLPASAECNLHIASDPWGQRLQFGEMGLFNGSQTADQKDE
jgi:hypothetical protein